MAKKHITVDNQYSDKIGLYCDSECTVPFTGTFDGECIYAMAKSEISEIERYVLSNLRHNSIANINETTVGSISIHYSYFDDVDTLTVKRETKPQVKIINPYSEYVKLYRKFSDIYDDETETNRREYSLPIEGVCYLSQGDSVYVEILDDATDGMYTIGDANGKNKNITYSSVSKLGKGRAGDSI